MTQRVTDEQARYVEGGLVFPGSVPTSIDLAADLLDARAEIELLKGEVKHAETRSGMANVVAQFEAQLKVECAEIAALKAKLGAVDVEDVRDVANAVFDIDQPCTDPETMCVICARRVGAARRLLAAVGEGR